MNIDVRANTQAFEANVRRITAELNSLARTAAQLSNQKFKPISESDIGDAQELEKTLRQIMSMHPSIATAVRASGQNPATPTSVNWQNVPLTPNQVRTMFQHIGGGDQRFQKDDAQSIGEHIARGMGRFFGGLGGGAGQVGNSAMSGGFGAGGFSGMGLLRGGLMGAGLFGAYKAGQMVMEGYENARTLAIEMDKLKRQMGDIGVSFNVLQAAAQAASDGLEINAVEAGKLMTEFNHLSGGVKDTTDLTEGTRSGVGMSKALGLDPSAGVSFLANIRNINRGGSADGDRRLALMIGDVITRSGMNGRADEVLQAVQSFAASTARISLSNPNLSAFSGLYSGMLASRIPGLTAENAAAMIGQANSAVTNMGAFGEASETFTMGALSRDGRLNPIQARVLAEGGLFGNRAGAFGKGSVYRQYMLANGVSESEVDKLMAGNSGRTNFEEIRRQLDEQNVDPHIKAEMAKNYFGLSSINQAMAFMSIKPEEMGKTEHLLGSRGIDLKGYNETGIMTLSKIANAGKVSDLQDVANDMMSRKGKGSLTADERNRLAAAMEEAKRLGGNEGFSKLQDTLTDLAADKDKQQTLGSQMVDQQKKIENAMIDVGQTLLGPLTDIKEVLMAGFKVSETKAREKVRDIRKDDVNDDIDKKIAAAKLAYNKEGTVESARMRRFLGAPGVNDAYVDARQKAKDEMDRQIAELEKERAERLGKVDSDFAAESDARDKQRRVERRLMSQRDDENSGPVGDATGRQISAMNRVQFSDAENRALEQAAGGDQKKLAFMKNVLRIENRGKASVDNDAVSPAGAAGAFQFMPNTAATLARRLGMRSYDLKSFDDSSKLAGAYYDELHERYGGNRSKMYADYNGGPRLARNAGNTGNKENDDYVAMGKYLDGQSTPMPSAGKDVMSNYPQTWQKQSLAPWDLTFKLIGEDGKQRAAPINISVPIPAPSGRG